MKQANNFGLDISTLRAPHTVEHLNHHEKQGYSLAEINLSEIVNRGSMDVLIAAKQMIIAAEADGLEVDNRYGSTTLRKPLTDAELEDKIKDKADRWERGLRAYLWIAADESNAVAEKDRYATAGGASSAHSFMNICEEMGTKVTPFWEFEYTTLVGYEYDYPKSANDMTVEHFAKHAIESKVLHGEIAGSND